MDIKIGVVGLGPHFREILLPALISQDSVIMTAFCNHDVDAMNWVGKRFPNALITDQVSDKNFWDAIDCVVCCSWPSVHEQVLALAIDHSKHCFCEKPAASNVAQLNQVLQKHQPAGLIIKVGHVFRYMGGGARFISLTEQKNLTCLEVTYLGSGPRGSRWGMSSPKSFSLTHLTHAVDFVVAVAGEIAMIQSVAWSNEGDRHSVSILCRTERCALVNIFATNAAAAFTCKATGVFPSGALIHLDNLRSVTITGQTPEEKRSGSIWVERDLGTMVQNDGYIDELRDFFAEIHGQSHCRLPGLIQARHVLSVIEEIQGKIGY